MRTLLTSKSVLFLILIATLFFCQKSHAEDKAPTAKNEDATFSSVEERRILMKMQDVQTSAASEQKGLAIREKELKTLSEEVDKKLGEIDRKLEELQAMQKTLKTLLAQKNTEELKKLKELGLIYEKMAPEKAGFALANMNDKLATDILANMKVKSAAKILNVLDRKKTSELSTTFSTVK